MKLKLSLEEINVIRMCLEEYIVEKPPQREIANMVAHELSTVFLHRLERIQLLMSQKGKLELAMKVTYCEIFILQLIQDIVSHDMGFVFSQRIYADINRLIVNGNEKTLK